MAITETIQAKEFTAGAPNITLKGDLRPNQMMAMSDDANERALEQIFEQLLEEGFSIEDAAKRAREIFNERAMADGGRAQYGLGSFVKSIGKAVKGVAKGVTGAIRKNPLLAAAAFNFAPMLFDKAPLIGLGKTAGSLGTIFKDGLPTLGTGKEGFLKTFAIGSLGGTLLAAAEAGGLETSDPNAEVDLESIKGYLSRGYKNLNPEATDEEVFQFVQENTAEYRAMGGRIGYDNGGYTFEQFMKDKGKVDQFMGEQEMRKLYEKMMREKKIREQKTMAATGGRIGYSEGNAKFEYGTKEYFKNNLDVLELDEYIKKPYTLNPFAIGVIEERLKEYADSGGDISPYLKKYNLAKQKNAEYFQSLSEDEKKSYVNRQKQMLQEDVEMGIFPGQDELGIVSVETETDSGKKIPAPKKDPFDIEGFKDKYGYRADAAIGGRMNYAMGTDDKVMMAAGIEGLPVRQNKAGVKELDLRETGGFIQPVGIKEKADDIPAMLSNNEFVFTADAVRAAGGGDVDKGAQLMYNTMKKLESKVV